MIICYYDLWFVILYYYSSCCCCRSCCFYINKYCNSVKLLISLSLCILPSQLLSCIYVSYCKAVCSWTCCLFMFSYLSSNLVVFNLCSDNNGVTPSTVYFVFKLWKALQRLSSYTSFTAFALVRFFSSLYKCWAIDRVQFLWKEASDYIPYNWIYTTRCDDDDGGGGGYVIIHSQLCVESCSLTELYAIPLDTCALLVPVAECALFTAAVEGVNVRVYFRVVHSLSEHGGVNSRDWSNYFWETTGYVWDMCALLCPVNISSLC